MILFSYSATKAGKFECGDAFAMRELKEENLVVMVVADGISSLPCDWLASKTACALSDRRMILAEK
jgi:hypothetical protein